MPVVPSPMLATLGNPPSGDGWAFEMKWDGQRALADKRSGTTRLFSRNAKDISGSYPELAAAIDDALEEGPRSSMVRSWPWTGKAGRRSARLQRRMHVLKPTSKLIGEIPVSFYVFDVLELDGEELVRQPYLERRTVLDELGLSAKSVQNPRSGQR